MMMDTTGGESRPRHQLFSIETMRIPWAIAAKDLVDAAKNRNILLNLIGMVFIMGLYKLVPMLWEAKHFDIVIYDAGNSNLLAALIEDPDFRIHLAPTPEMFEELMNDGDSGKLGLFIPADYDELLEAGEQTELGGYLLWQHRNRADDIRIDYEKRLTEFSGSDTTIRILGSVKHEPASMGTTRMTSLMMVMALFYVGILSVPFLMLEEKLAKTLSSLMISPASVRQVVWGKALAGMLFVLMSMVVVLAFNWTFVVDWVVACLALISGALLAVGLGLFLGMQFESKQKMNSWILIAGQPLLIPVFLSMVDPIFPESVRSALSWVPTVAISLLFRYSFSSGASATQIVTSLAVVMLSVLMVFAVVAWKVRRMDR